MPLPEAIPVVEIVLDRTRRLALTLGAMRRIQAETGHSVTELGALLQGNPMEHLGGILWASLVNEDRDLTRADLEEMLHPGNLEMAVGVLNELLATLVPVAKGAEGKDAAAVAPLARSISKRSGRKASTTSDSRTLSSGR